MKVNSAEFGQIQSSLCIRFRHYGNIELIPQSNGKFEYFPQQRYKNIKNYPLIAGITSDTPFCKFRPNLPSSKGVYLWVVDDEITYIGEAVNLCKRFNAGYGHISPRNCFLGGQSTNIKMNRVALNTIVNLGKAIEIYLFLTEDHKQLEKELLLRISTPYNKKNN